MVFRLTISFTCEGSSWQWTSACRKYSALERRDFDTKGFEEVACCARAAASISSLAIIANPLGSATALDRCASAAKFQAAAFQPQNVVRCALRLRGGQNHKAAIIVEPLSNQHTVSLTGTGG